MSDFVDRLLGRVEPPPIRPLIPTMFEPLSCRPADPPLQMGRFSDTGSDVAAEPPGHDAIPAAALPGHLTTPVTAVPEPSRPSESVVRDLHTHTRNDHSHRTERLIAETHNRTVPVAARADSPSAPAEAPSGSAAIYTDHPASHAVSTPVPPPTRALPGWPVRPGAQRAPRNAEPDVLISIGRVEIKADPPRTLGPDPVRVLKRPRLSLDDYLRARGAGQL